MSSFRASYLPLLILSSLITSCSDGSPDGSVGELSSSGGNGAADASGGAPSSGGSAFGDTGSGGATSSNTTSGGTSSLGSGGSSAAAGGSEAAAGSGGASSGGDTGSGGDAATGGADGSGGAANQFEPCPTNGDACAILPLGDSITEGFGSSGGGYRVNLFRQTLAAEQKITFVGTLVNGPNTVDGQPFPRSHQGHGGFAIDAFGNANGISGMITQNALNSFHPHIVLLMIGTNDVNGNFDLANAPNRLKNLVEDITTRAPDSLLVLASIIPIRNSGTNQKVITYNNEVKKLADEMTAADKHVVFVDNYDAIESTPNWSNAVMKDDLHPNDAGYDILGQSFYDTIKDYLH